MKRIYVTDPLVGYTATDDHAPRVALKVVVVLQIARRVVDRLARPIRVDYVGEAISLDAGPTHALYFG